MFKTAARFSSTFLAVAIIGLTLVPSPVRAQRSPDDPSARSADTSETPETVAEHYAAAMRAGDWVALTSLMHPDALRKFRGFFAPIVEENAFGEVGKVLFGVDKAADFAALSDSEVFRRLFGFLASNTPALKEALGGAAMTVIGHVNEGPDTVHLVFRMRVSVQGIAVEKVDVMPMRRHGATWLVLLSGDMEGVAAALRAQLAK